MVNMFAFGPHARNNLDANATATACNHLQIRAIATENIAPSSPTSTNTKRVVN